MKPIFTTMIVGWCCLLPACGKTSETDRFRAAMLRVLQADQQLADKREQETKAAAGIAQAVVAVESYCSGLERLDMSDCPAGFRVAYRHHIRAWREAVAALRQVPDGFWEGAIVGLLNGLTGEVDGGYGRLSEALQAADQRINETFEEIERIAAEHGAAL